MEEYKFNQLKEKFSEVGYKNIQYTYKITKISKRLKENKINPKLLNYLFYLKTKVADKNHKL